LSKKLFQSTERDKRTEFGSLNIMKTSRWRSKMWKCLKKLITTKKTKEIKNPNLRKEKIRNKLEKS